MSLKTESNHIGQTQPSVRIWNSFNIVIWYISNLSFVKTELEGHDSFLMEETTIDNRTI